VGKNRSQRVSTRFSDLSGGEAGPLSVSSSQQKNIQVIPGGGDSQKVLNGHDEGRKWRRGRGAWTGNRSIDKGAARLLQGRVKKRIGKRRVLACKTRAGEQNSN